jgi:hypothetical protein
VNNKLPITPIHDRLWIVFILVPFTDHPKQKTVEQQLLFYGGGSGLFGRAKECIFQGLEKQARIFSKPWKTCRTYV